MLYKELYELFLKIKWHDLGREQAEIQGSLEEALRHLENRATLDESALVFDYEKELQSIVVYCAWNMRSEKDASGNLDYNIRLVASAVEKLLVKSLFKSGFVGDEKIKPYFAGLRELDCVPNELKFFTFLDFLRFRIFAHIEMLVRVANRFPPHDLLEQQAELKSFISDELKTYYVMNLIQEIKISCKKMKDEQKQKVVEHLAQVLIKDMIKLGVSASLSLEAGWNGKAKGEAGHSIYVQFYKREKNKVEIYIHDRRRSNDSNQKLTKSIGTADLFPSDSLLGSVALREYLKFYLQFQMKISPPTQESYEKRIASKSSNRFDAPETKPEEMQDQNVGNCIVASHDSVMLNVCGRQLATYLRTTEENMVKNKVRILALRSLRNEKNDFPAIPEFDSVDCDDEIAIARAIQENGKEDWEKLGVTQKKEAIERVLEINRRFIERVESGREIGIATSRAIREKGQEAWGKLDSRQKDDAITQVLLDRDPAFFVVSRLIQAQYNDPTFKSYLLRFLKNHSDEDTSDIFKFVLENYGIDPVTQKIDDEVYKVCYDLAIDYSETTVVPYHRRSYVFFGYARKLLSEKPELIKDAIKHLNRVDDPPDEEYHYAAMKMLEYVWGSSHRLVIKEELERRLSSNEVLEISCALSIIEKLESGLIEFKSQLLDLLPKSVAMDSLIRCLNKMLSELTKDERLKIIKACVDSLLNYRHLPWSISSFVEQLSLAEQQEFISQCKGIKHFSQELIAQIIVDCYFPKLKTKPEKQSGLTWLDASAFSSEVYLADKEFLSYGLRMHAQMINLAIDLDDKLKVHKFFCSVVESRPAKHFSPGTASDSLSNTIDDFLPDFGILFKAIKSSFDGNFLKDLDPAETKSFHAMLNEIIKVVSDNERCNIPWYYYEIDNYGQALLLLAELSLKDEDSAVSLYEKLYQRFFFPAMFDFFDRELLSKLIQLACNSSHGKLKTLGEDTLIKRISCDQYQEFLVGFEGSFLSENKKKLLDICDLVKEGEPFKSKLFKALRCVGAIKTHHLVEFLYSLDPERACQLEKDKWGELKKLTKRLKKSQSEKTQEKQERELLKEEMKLFAKHRVASAPSLGSGPRKRKYSKLSQIGQFCISARGSCDKKRRKQKDELIKEVAEKQGLIMLTVKPGELAEPRELIDPGLSDNPYSPPKP